MSDKRLEENCCRASLSSLAICPDPQQIMISNAPNVGPRERPWLREFGITSFAIAVRIHGEDGEGSALAAIVVLESREKDAKLRRNS